MHKLLLMECTTIQGMLSLDIDMIKVRPTNSRQSSEKYTTVTRMYVVTLVRERVMRSLRGGSVLFVTNVPTCFEVSRSDLFHA